MLGDVEGLGLITGEYSPSFRLRAGAGARVRVGLAAIGTGDGCRGGEDLDIVSGIESIGDVGALSGITTVSFSPMMAVTSWGIWFVS